MSIPSMGTRNSSTQQHREFLKTCYGIKAQGAVVRLALCKDDACLVQTNGGDRIQSQENCNDHKSLTSLRNDHHWETAHPGIKP